MKEPTVIYVIDEHNEAFYLWHKARYEGYLNQPLDLYHIDAHDDMGKPEALRNSIYPPSDPTHSPLEYYAKLAKKELHHGNFIVPAVLAGLVRNIYFIYPKWRKFKPHRKKYNVASAFGEGKILKYDMKTEKGMEAKLSKALPDLTDYNYTMCDIDRIPKNRKVILDIDLDYFACCDSISNHLSYELEITEEQFQQRDAFLEDKTLTFAGFNFNFVARDGKFLAQVAHKTVKDLSYLPTQETIVSEIDTLLATLEARNTKPVLVTIARSCLSGYCPKEYGEFIEAELTGRLKAIIN